MVKNGKELNRFELKLQKDIENLMLEKGVKFSVFLPVLRPDMPEDKSSNDYKNKHKAEYLKQLRASYSVNEVANMLDILGYEIIFKVGKQKLRPATYNKIDVKLKYTDVMATCELLGIEIEWVKYTDRAVI